MYTLPATLSDDIQYYGSLIDEFLEGKIEPVKFKAVRVPMGIYEQRRDGTYMVRIRCAGGFITPSQLKKATEIARKHQSDLIHVTTRQEIQIQNVDLRETLAIHQRLKEIGLSPKGGGGNTVRNIMASVDSGISTQGVFDVTPYAWNLTTRLIAEPDSFTLPRKFKIAFSDSEDDTALAAFNDLGFVARIKEGRRGFKVFLGGSLGSKPLTGYELFSFAPEEELYYIADAAKKLFSRYGNRKNKHKARLRYVFYRLGKEEVFRLFFEIYNEVKHLEALRYSHTSFGFSSPDPAIPTELPASQEFEKWKERYVTPQKQQGLYTVVVPFENGNIGAEDLGHLAELAAQFGDDVIRFSMRQNLHFRNIPEAYLGNVFNLLVKTGIDLHLPLLLNTVVACTGADTCRLGICYSKGASAALRKTLKNSNLPLDRLKDLRINISGCPNSCGQQAAADLGFYGKVGRNDRMYPAYHVVAGASVGPEPKLAELVGEVSAYDLPKFTAEVLRLYLEKEDRYPSFSEYVRGEGKSDIARTVEQYRTIPDFRDDKNYYFDWGGEQLFSLAAKGVGECSAGLFDMIEVDLSTIERIRKELPGEADQAVINQLLYTLIFASSRMLLITRGAEPRNTTEVFDEFIQKFIEAKLVSAVFRETVELARDNRNADFLEKRDTIVELSLAITALYENMDDSLQFRNLENGERPGAAETPRQVTSRKKDFRGVACPMNFVKTKIELATLKSGDLLEILLDDGEPIENVPGSIKGEGHKVLDQKKVDGHWQVTIEKV